MFNFYFFHVTGSRTRTIYRPSENNLFLDQKRKLVLVLEGNLSELAGPMLKLAGTRVNPKNNYYHGRHGGTSPRVLTIKNGKTVLLNIPEEAEVMSTYWTADGQRFAMSIGFENRIELGSVASRKNNLRNA